MVHNLVNIYSLQSFKSQSLCNTYFYGLRGRQTQGPPRAAHTLATPLYSLLQHSGRMQKPGRALALRDNKFGQKKEL